jgi:hypothetical protein
VPSDLLFITSGRDELDQNNWSAYEVATERLSLEPFAEEEARGFLALKKITDERVVNVVLELSDRLPILLATLAAESSTDPMKVGDASGTAVECFLKWVNEPQKRTLALNAALPRHFNKDIVRLQIEGDIDSLFDWLKRMPFVKQRLAQDGWVYHEVVRQQMLRYRRHESANE